MRIKKEWNVGPSTYAKSTFNPIRSIIENLEINPNPEKAMIALSIGDPTVFGNLQPAKEITDAVLNSVKKGTNNGYAPSTGYVEAREAVAEYCSTPQCPLNAKVTSERDQVVQTGFGVRLCAFFRTEEGAQSNAETGLHYSIPL